MRRFQLDDRLPRNPVSIVSVGRLGGDHRAFGDHRVDLRRREAVLLENLAGVLAVERRAGAHLARRLGKLDRQAQCPDGPESAVLDVDHVAAVRAVPRPMEERSAGFDVGLREIVALEQEALAGAPGEGISQTVAKI